MISLEGRIRARARERRARIEEADDARVVLEVRACLLEGFVLFERRRVLLEHLGHVGDQGLGARDDDLLLREPDQDLARAGEGHSGERLARRIFGRSFELALGKRVLLARFAEGAGLSEALGGEQRFDRLVAAEAEHERCFGAPIEPASAHAQALHVEEQAARVLFREIERLGDDLDRVVEHLGLVGRLLVHEVEPVHVEREATDVRDLEEELGVARQGRRDLGSAPTEELVVSERAAAADQDEEADHDADDEPGFALLLGSALSCGRGWRGDRDGLRGCVGLRRRVTRSWARLRRGSAVSLGGWRAVTLRRGLLAVTLRRGLLAVSLGGRRAVTLGRGLLAVALRCLRRGRAAPCESACANAG